MTDDLVRSLEAVRDQLSAALRAEIQQSSRRALEIAGLHGQLDDLEAENKTLEESIASLDAFKTKALHHLERLQNLRSGAYTPGAVSLEEELNALEALRREAVHG